MEISRPTKIPSLLLLSVLTLFVFLFVFFLYTFLHELGHAITGLLFGQRLTAFNVNFWDLSAHVRMAGGQLTQTQLALRSISGVGLPLVAWMLFILLVPRKSSFLLETLKLVASMAVINTLVVWIILPILFLFGKAPSDDVLNFLSYSQIQPLLVSVLSLILYAGAWALFIAKIDGLRNEFLLFRASKDGVLAAGTRKTLAVMAILITAGLVAVFALNSFADQNPADRLALPPDFANIAQLDLSKQAYSSQTLTQFVLEKPSIAAVFLVVRNIDTTYFDLSLTGPDGFHSTILHGEGYNASQDGGLWQKNLPAGTYQLVLTSHQSPGTASIYFQIR